MLENSDAALLIGDPALRLAISLASYATLGPAGESICDARENRRRCHRTFACVRCGSGMAAAERAPAVLAIWAATARSDQRRKSWLISRRPGIMASRIFRKSATPRRRPWRLPAPGSAHVPGREHQLQSEPRKSWRAGTYYCLAAKLGLIPEAKAIQWADADSQTNSFQQEEWQTSFRLAGSNLAASSDRIDRIRIRNSTKGNP